MKKRILLVLLALLLFPLTSPHQVTVDPIQRLVAPHRFSLVRWELRALPEKWVHRVTRLFPSPANASTQEAMAEFLVLGQDLQRLEEQIRQEAALGNQAQVRYLEEQHRATLSLWEGRRPDVERALEGVLGTVIRDLGLAMAPLGLFHIQFPPVDLRFARQPYVLALSPRDRIELVQTLLLQSDMTVREMEELERVIQEQEDLSALVVQPGGVATYPAVIPSSLPLRDTLVLAAHEWVHHYLWFYPLGRSYFADPRMVTVNETLADMVGKELGEEAFRRLGGEVPPPPEDPAPPPAETPDFDFAREMRQTRLRVEALLSQGDVQRAEAYMDERRRDFAQHGHPLRRLNQAYFAFHGTYATSPASISPVGGQLEELRQRLGSLEGLVKALAGVGDFEEYLTLLKRYGVATAAPATSGPGAATARPPGPQCAAAPAAGSPEAPSAQCTSPGPPAGPPGSPG